MSTTLFQARFDISGVVDLGGTPNAWRVTGTVNDSSPSNFNATNVQLNDIFFDESAFDGTVNRYLVTSIISASGVNLTVDCIYDEPGTPGGLFPYPVASSGAICRATDDIDLTQRPATGWTQVSETIKNAIRNEDMRRLDREVQKSILNETVVTTTPYTVLADDKLIVVDCTIGDITVNVPAAADNDKRTLYFKKIDSTENKMIIDPNGTEKIDGETTQEMWAQYEAISIVSNGTEWWIV